MSINHLKVIISVPQQFVQFDELNQMCKYTMKSSSEAATMGEVVFHTAHSSTCPSGPSQDLKPLALI